MSVEVASKPCTSHQQVVDRLFTLWFLATCQFGMNCMYGPTEFGFVAESLLHASAGMQDGRVVAAAEVGGDVRVDGTGQFSGQQHGTLSRQYDVLGSATFSESAGGNSEVPRNNPRDLAQAGGLSLNVSGNHLLGEPEVDHPSVDPGKVLELSESGKQVPGRTGDASGKHLCGIDRQGDLVPRGEVLKEL